MYNIYVLVFNCLQALDFSKWFNFSSHPLHSNAEIQTLCGEIQGHPTNALQDPPPIETKAAALGLCLQQWRMSRWLEQNILSSACFKYVTSLISSVFHIFVLPRFFPREGRASRAAAVESDFPSDNDK